tara:strand:+ start:83 stop:415 length:333 start_codon:yes stop_codon:yes gene_type:complete
MEYQEIRSSQIREEKEVKKEEGREKKRKQIKLENDLYGNGYDDGYKKGYKHGHWDRFREDRGDGYDDGYKKGYKHGHYDANGAFISFLLQGLKEIRAKENHDTNDPAQAS